MQVQCVLTAAVSASATWVGAIRDDGDGRGGGVMAPRYRQEDIARKSMQCKRSTGWGADLSGSKPDFKGRHVPPLQCSSFTSVLLSSHHPLTGPGVTLPPVHSRVLLAPTQENALNARLDLLQEINKILQAWVELHG